MNFDLKGTLWGAVCNDRTLPLQNTLVRLYRAPQEQTTELVAARPKELFRLYSDAALKEQAGRFLAEVRTDANGNYHFDLNNDEHDYQGEALEIVAYYPEVPDYGQDDRQPPRNFDPFGVRLNVFYPKWTTKDEAVFYSRYHHTISTKSWCGEVAPRLDLWFIAGTLALCETKQPLRGIEVIAMDDDLISDDRLGSDVTDEAGAFLIVYTTRTFKKTFLSPLINVETPFSADSGPDVYFRYAVDGRVFFSEGPQTGQRKDRINRTNCFCVDLCLEEGPIVPPRDSTTIPAFFKMGTYHILDHLDATTGLTAGRSNAGLNRLAFHRTVGLQGSLNNNVTAYKFQYQELAQPSDALDNWSDVDGTYYARTIIGYTQALTGDPANPVDITNYAIGANAAAGDVPVVVTNSWVQVPQLSNFVVNTNGPLANLDSTRLAQQTVDVSGLVPGQSATTVTSGAALPQNRYFQLRLVVRTQDANGNAVETVAGTSRAFALCNLTYTNVPQYGSWLSREVDRLGVASLDIKELNGQGCEKLTDALTLQYTASHPNLGTVAFSMQGPSGPHAFDAVNYRPSGQEAYGEAAYTGGIAALPSCSYIVNLAVQLRLTNGTNRPDPIRDRIAFAK